MAVGAGAALLRSAATKMARAPPRLPSALERHGRFSTSSSGSTPTRGPQIDIKEVRSGSQWERAKTVVIETATMCAVLTVPAVVFLCFWVNPELDRINAERARRDMEIVDEIKRRHQRIREQIDSIKS